MRRPLTLLPIPFALPLCALILCQCADDDSPVPVPAAEGPQPMLVAVAELRATDALPELFDIVRKEITKGTLDVAGKELLREEHLPMRVHVFVNETADKFLMDIETAVPLDAKTLSEKIADQPLVPVRGMTDAWTGGGMSLRAMPAGPGRPRLLIGDLFGPEPAQNPWFHHLLEAKLTKPDERLLAKVKDSFGFALIRGGVLAQANPMTQQFLAFAGPRGLNMVAGVRAEGGRPVIDYHLGLRVGEGIVGTMLPKDAGDATPLVVPPFVPAVVSLIDLGPSVARVAEFGLSMAQATGMPEELVEALRTVVDSATGKINVFGGNGDRTLVLIELDDDTEKDIDGVLEQLQKLVQSPAGKTELRRNGKILELSMIANDVKDGSGPKDWKSPFSAFPAPVKIWLGAQVLQRMEEAQKAVPPQLQNNAAYMRGVAAGQSIARALFKDKIEMFITWSTKGTHVRMKL